MKKRVPIAIAAVLTACGAVATTSNDSADSAPQKNTSAKAEPSSTEIPSATNASAGQGTSDPWVGTYTGNFQGGGGEVTISRASGKQYNIEASVGGPGCSGGISGVGTVSGNRLSFSDKMEIGDNGSAICTMTLARQGNRLSVSGAGECHFWSGMSCGMDGTVTRQGASGVSEAAPQVTARPFIVGAWVARGFACGGDGAIYAADGTYATDAQAGRWQLSGNTLIETALETVEMGEGETPIENPRPVRSQILSVAPNRNAFTMRTADGETWHMVRCR